MLIFLIIDVTNTEDVFHDGIMSFVEQELVRFKWAIIGLTIGLVIYLLTFLLGLIKTQLVAPIINLTEYIYHP